VSTLSPVAFRRFNALSVKQWRIEKELLASDVAKALDCTVTKISYIEGCERNISLGDMEALLRFFEIPEDRWPIHLNAARAAKQKGWWDKLPAGTIPPWFSLFVGLEAGASEIRKFEALVVPGLLQNRDYARALIAGGTAELTAEEIERRTDVRIGRQGVLDRGLRLWVIIDEAALWRVVGNPAIHVAQLEHVLAILQQHAKVTVQVIPFSVGAHTGVQGSFTIMDFPWSHDPGVVYLEGQGDSQILEDKAPDKGKDAKDDGHSTAAEKKPSPLAVHRIAWEHLVAKALDPADSEAKIQQVIKELKQR